MLLGLTFKALDYDIRYIDGSKREHKSEAYLEINPRGKIPSLVTEGPTLRDSIAILAWLDRAYPNRPLFGADADQAAAIWQVTMESCDYLRDAADALLRPIFFGEEKKKTAELIEAAEMMWDEFARLETLLEYHKFLAGDLPTAADAVSYPEARIVQRGVETHAELLASLGIRESFPDFPRVSTWMRRVEDVDGFAKTLPPHWNA